MKRDVFHAIADPTRRKIIGMLSFQSLNVNDLSKRFEITRPGVAKHIKVLKECGVIEVEKRGRERFCHAKLEALAEAATWINQYRMFWNDRINHLERLLQEEDNKNAKP